MAAAPIGSGDVQAARAADPQAQGQHDAAGPHMLVKTVLPPANFIRAVQGGFSGLPYTARASDTREGPSDAASAPSGAATGDVNLSGPCEEVVLATTTTLRLVSLPAAEADLTGASFQPAAMATGDAEVPPTLDESEGSGCRILCEQPVFGTITCLSVLKRRRETADLLLMLILESPQLLILEFQRHLGRFETIARVSPMLAHRAVCTAAAPDGSAIAVSAPSGDPVVIQVLSSEPGMPLVLSAPVPVPLAECLAAASSSQAPISSARPNVEAGADVEVDSGGGGAIAQGAALRQAPLGLEVPQPPPPPDGDGGAGDGIAMSAGDVAALKQWLHLQPEPSARPVKVEAMCFAEGEDELRQAPTLMVLTSMRNARKGDKPQTLWRCRLPSLKTANVSPDNQPPCVCSEVAEVGEGAVFELEQPQAGRPLQLPMHTNDVTFNGMAPVPGCPGGVLLLYGGIPWMMVLLSEEAGSPTRVHHVQCSSETSSWCWERTTSAMPDEKSQWPPLLTVEKGGCLLRIRGPACCEGAEAGACPEYPYVGQLEGPVRWMLSLGEGRLLAAARRGGADLLATEAARTDGRNTYVKVATIAAGDAAIASSLLLADLEGLSQPQLYSVCGGGIPPPSPTAATHSHSDLSSRHIRVAYPHPVPEAIFESPPDYGGVTGLWALPARPCESEHALVVLSFVNDSRALSTAGAELTDATDAVALASDESSITAGCIGDLLIAQVTPGRVQLCSLVAAGDGDPATAEGEGGSPRASMGKRQASWATMEGISDAFAARLAPFGYESDSGGGGGGSPRGGSGTLSRAPGGSGNWGPAAGMPLRGSTGPLGSFNRLNRSFGSTGSFGAALWRESSNMTERARQPVDLWLPPQGSTISVSVVVPGAVLLSCAGGKSVSALVLEQQSRGGMRRSGEGNDGGKRKRAPATACDPVAHLTLATQASVAAELSCIAAAPAGDALCGEAGATLVCVGTHEPALELLLLVGTAAAAAGGGSPQNPGQPSMSAVHIRPLARLPLLPAPTSLPVLWPSAIGTDTMEQTSQATGVLSGSNVGTWGSPVRRFHPSSPLPDAQWSHAASGQHGRLQSLLGSAVRLTGAGSGSDSAGARLHLQPDIPESLLLLPPPTGSSTEHQVVAGLRGGGLLRVAAHLEATSGATLQQVGHVQQLGSLPVSLLQLPAATQAAPTLQGGSTSVTVALALGERPWLLQRHVSSGVETAWPRASPLCSPRVLRAVALTLPAGDEEAPHRCLVLGSSADGCLRLVDVAAASQSRRLHITAPPPLPPPPHHMTDSRPPDGSASPSAGPQHEARMLGPHLAVHPPSGLLIAVQEAPPLPQRAPHASYRHPPFTLPCPPGPQLIAVETSTGSVLAVHEFKPGVAITAMIVWPTLTAMFEDDGDEGLAEVPENAPLAASPAEDHQAAPMEMEGQEVQPAGEAVAAPRPPAAPFNRLRQLLPGGRQAGDHGALDPLMPPAQPQEPLPGLAARPDHFQQHLDVARLQQQPQRLAAAPQAWQFDAPQPPLQQDASGNRRTDNPEGSSGGHQSTPQGRRDGRLEHFVVVATAPQEGFASQAHQHAWSTGHLSAGGGAGDKTWEAEKPQLHLLRLVPSPLASGMRSASGAATGPAHPHASGVSSGAGAGWRWEVEGATRVRGEVHVAAPSQLAGLLLAGHHRSLTAFCLLNRKGASGPLQAPAGNSSVGAAAAASATATSALRAPQGDTEGDAGTGWSFGSRRREARLLPGGSGSFDGEPFPRRSPSPSPPPPPQPPQGQETLRQWSLQRHAHTKLPVPLARHGLHADAASGAVAICDPRHSVRLLGFDPLNRHEHPFEVVRADESARPAVACLALPPAAEGTEVCEDCGAACGPPEQARAVAADEGGCLTVLVPDDCHHGTECNLLPAASFSLGSVATTLAMGGLAFDGQQSSDAGEGEGPALAELQAALSTRLSQELPPAHHPASSPARLLATSPARQPGTLAAAAAVAQQQVAAAEGAAAAPLAFAAAAASGAVVAAARVDGDTYALLAALERVLVTQPDAAPLAGECQATFRGRGVGQQGGGTGTVKRGAGTLQCRPMLDGDLLTTFLHLPVARQQACVQAAVSKLATDSSGEADPGAAAEAPSALAPRQLASLTLAVAARLEGVLTDMD